MTPPIHWPTNHSPITHTDPSDPPNPPKTHLTWPFPYFMLYDVLHFTNHIFTDSSWHPLSLDPLTTHPSPTQTHQIHQTHPDPTQPDPFSPQRPLSTPNDHSPTYTLLAVWANLTCHSLTFWVSHCCTKSSSDLTSLTFVCRYYQDVIVMLKPKIGENKVAALLD